MVSFRIYNFPNKVPHDLLVFLSESETGLKVENRISRVAVEIVEQMRESLKRGQEFAEFHLEPSFIEV